LKTRRNFSSSSRTSVRLENATAETSKVAAKLRNEISFATQLRMRPDRIVIVRCRGGEAIDMLQAMNTGHDGSLTTIHANTPRDALSRLETMIPDDGHASVRSSDAQQVASRSISWCRSRACLMVRVA
jgi:Flp pilus assembly CpaF family ATPase